MGDKLGRVAEVGEGTGLATSHVVSACGLREPLKETNKENDLPFGGIGEGIPLLGRAAGGSSDTATDGRPGEGDAIGLDDITYEGCHGDAAVLDLGVTEEADGRLVALSPDGG